MKKSIGLSVCYDTKNFGSQLQVLATIRKIKELGYDTEIIRYKKKLTLKLLLQTIPRLFNPYFIHNKLSAQKRLCQISKHPELAAKINMRNLRFEKFCEKYFVNLSEYYYGWEELTQKASNSYSGFLCGSDQLWLPANLGSHFYTLEFVPDHKIKIAYATSFGVSNIPWFQKRRTARYLNRFNHLSSRETRGSEIIKELTGIYAPTVLDPTLLFSGNEWLQIIPEEKIVNRKYIFCFFLGKNEEHREIANLLKDQLSLDIVTIPFMNDYSKTDEGWGDLPLYNVDAADFVNLIRHAEYILTDSFHGSVFSILYHKQFIVFNRFRKGMNSRNSRIESLCSLLSLENRHEWSDMKSDITAPIDYEAVEKKLKKLRMRSINYLCKALQDI